MRLLSVPLGLALAMGSATAVEFVPIPLTPGTFNFDMIVEKEAPPPPVQGLGTTGGFKLYIEDRAGRGYDDLAKVTADVLAEARQIQYEPSTRSTVTGIEQDFDLTPRVYSLGLRFRF